MSTDGSVSPVVGASAAAQGLDARACLAGAGDRAVVSHPANPLVLRWSAVPHASKYLVTIASDPQLGSAVGGQQNVETSGTVYAPRASSFPPGTYYWGVT